MLPKNPPLIIGLAAPGLFWLATSVAPGQDTPQAPPGPPTKAPTASGSTPKAYRALLLSNGKVIRGEIAEDTASNMYRIHQGAGTVSYPRFKVLAVGDSIEDLYRFQADRLPDGDPDERMKLARWCLTELLYAQAKEQLEAVRAICPDDAEVKRMLYNLATTAEPTKVVDEGVRRTSAEIPRGEVPGSLDPRVISKAHRQFNALPEILDLPPAQAVKRANEFADFVQPVLQNNCAKCHGEKYPGEFQLVEVRSRRDQMNPDIARANLDATLRLINPDDPSRSPLLSAGLVPHGGSKSAIFRGPNDKNYQILSQWARSLRPAKGPGSTGGQAATGRGFGENVTRTGFAPADTRSGGFGSERGNRSSAYPGSSEPTDAPPMPFVPQGQRVVDRVNESAEFVNAAGDNPQFPAPFAVGGAPPIRQPPPRTKPGDKPGSSAEPPTTPAVSKRTAAPAGTGAVTFEATADPNELPGMDLQRYPPKADQADDGAADAKKKKPKAIDNAALEKVLKSRNGAGTP